MVAGFNVSQFLRNCSLIWKKDKVWTRVLVVVVTTVNMAFVIYGGIYADYLISISVWDPDSTASEFTAQGVFSNIAGGLVIL